jgi:hypothetical protein
MSDDLLWQLIEGSKSFFFCYKFSFHTRLSPYCSLETDADVSLSMHRSDYIPLESLLSVLAWVLLLFTFDDAADCLFDGALFVFEGIGCPFFFPLSLFVFFFLSDLLFQPFDELPVAADFDVPFIY